MPKPKEIELPDGTMMSILYEDRSVLAIDKPAGWMLAPDSWDKTSRNLQLALVSSIEAGDFWARSRNVKFLRFVHRLDAETSGVLLMVKSLRAVQIYSQLFESRQVEKKYVAVVAGVPKQKSWVCRLKLDPDPRLRGRMRVDARQGKEAETHFEVLESRGGVALVEARPITGRTHQIRVHLAASGYPVVGDRVYGQGRSDDGRNELALRAIGLSYLDPFSRRPVRIEAAVDDFLKKFGWSSRLRNADDEQTRFSSC